METRTMEICKRCNGTGVVKHEVLVDPHKGEYEVTHSDCKPCLGNGRMIRIVTDELYPWVQGPATSSLWRFEK